MIRQYQTIVSIEFTLHTSANACVFNEQTIQSTVTPFNYKCRTVLSQCLSVFIDYIFVPHISQRTNSFKPIAYTVTHVGDCC